MLIREYEELDREAVVGLNRAALDAAGGHMPGPWERDLDDIAGVYTSSGGVFLIGEVDNEVVAMGALRRVDTQHAEVKRMRVHPDHQRRGYGEALLRELERRARALGVTRLSLDTTVVQVAAQRLYERSGFRLTGRTTFASFDVLLYEKDVN